MNFKIEPVNRTNLFFKRMNGKNSLIVERLVSMKDGETLKFSPMERKDLYNVRTTIQTTVKPLFKESRFMTKHIPEERSLYIKKVKI